jgi:hypothetical protein
VNSTTTYHHHLEAEGQVLELVTVSSRQHQAETVSIYFKGEKKLL